MLETDMMGKLKRVPKLPPDKKLEAIFLVVSEEAVSTAPLPLRRVPHPDIAGKVIIKGDIMSSGPSSSWDLPE